MQHDSLSQQAPLEQNRIRLLCNDQANMKVNDKPTGMNNPGAVGMQTTRDQSQHVRPFLSWRFGHENISMNFFPLLLIQKEQFSINV